MERTKNVNSEVSGKSDGLYDYPIELSKGSKKIILNQPGNIEWLIKIVKVTKGKKDIVKYVKTTGSTGSVKNNFKRSKQKALNSALFLFGKKYGSPTSKMFIDYSIIYARVENERMPKRENWKGKYISVIRNDKGQIVTWSKYGKKLEIQSDQDI